MTSTVPRSQRGRPNKVTKPQPPTARGRPTRGVVPGSQIDVHAHQIHQQAQAQAQAHQQAQAQYGVHAAPYVAAAHAAQHALEELKPEPDHSVFDNVGVDVGVGVGVPMPMGVEDYAAAAMESELGNVDAHGEAEPDADMEEDDHSVGASGLQQHVDLSTANMLANGGANVVGGGVVGQSVHDHMQEMQQGLAHVQQQQQQHQQQHQHQHQQQPQAQMGAPQQMQPSHQPMEPQVVGVTEELARDSGYQNLSVESALAKRLAREPGRRLATQRRPEQQLNLNRRSNVEALFAHISGTLAPQPCKNCHKGHGPWSVCVVVDGQMCGSCANCWFNASGARCSFHETRTQQPMAQHAGIMPAASTALPADANYRYTPAHSLLPPAHSNAMQAINFAGGGVPSMNNNPILQQLVSKAMNEVRSADRATRLYWQLEITAKQLALQYAEYEEATAGQNQPGGAGNQIGSGQHGMGDDGSA
ncbi:putative 3-ketodihydrosphingosine reductase tsc-10 [Triangularia setosa]|uniref:3-ketodihydrosphingosine reductase tsc-10 n=1 Tax=Triangularia setosa TaxID=2587417 RepID=A0AAN6W4K9_9PEZI|nr:putative 3-ketodihydrosphingosine reductase tsc-10 [Podospora setosa]